MLTHSFHLLISLSFPAGCSSRVDIRLEADLQDHSCYNTLVRQGGLPAIVTIDLSNAPPGHNGSGLFTGFNPIFGKTPSLITNALDGVFTGGLVRAITYKIWVYLDSSSDPDVTAPLITLGDCTSGASFYLWVENNHVVTGLKLTENFVITKHKVVGSAVSTGIY